MRPLKSVLTIVRLDPKPILWLKRTVPVTGPAVNRATKTTGWTGLIPAQAREAEFSTFLITTGFPMTECGPLRGRLMSVANHFLASSKHIDKKKRRRQKHFKLVSNKPMAYLKCTSFIIFTVISLFARN